MSTTVNPNTPVKTEKKVKIRIPLTRGDNSDVFVGVNDRTWVIKRGVEVEVPECVVTELKQQEEALAVAYNYNNSVASK
jgi:hypothetical protein